MVTKGWSRDLASKARKPADAGYQRAWGWSGREDSNLRPPEPHSGALPGCATPRPSLRDEFSTGPREAPRLRTCGRSVSRPWTDDEDAFLRQRYRRRTNAELGRDLGRSSAAVAFRLSSAGLTRRRPWAAKEDEYLRQHHGQMDNRALAKVLRRSENAVARRMSDLGVRRAFVWTPEADGRLTAGYTSMTNAELARILGTTDAVVAHRLHALGLGRGSDE